MASGAPTGRRTISPGHGPLRFERIRVRRGGRRWESLWNETGAPGLLDAPGLSPGAPSVPLPSSLFLVAVPPRRDRIAAIGRNIQRRSDETLLRYGSGVHPARTLLTYAS